MFIYNQIPSNYVILPHCVCVWLPVWSVHKLEAIALPKQSSSPIGGELWCPWMLLRSWAVQLCSGAVEFPRVTRMEVSCPTVHAVVRHSRCNAMLKRGKKKQRTTSSLKNTIAKSAHELFACGDLFKLDAVGRFLSAADWCNSFSLSQTGLSDNTVFLWRRQATKGKHMTPVHQQMLPSCTQKKYLCSKENWPDWENKSQIGLGGFKWCKRVGSYSGGWIRISQCMGVHSKYELLSGYHTPILWK